MSLSGALVYTYLAGTSTPATTYSDASGTANTNPVVADSAGRVTIYLQQGISYKYVVKTSAGVLIRTIDPVAATGTTSVLASATNTCQGRLTLTSGVPVTTADVTAATTVYYSPYAGNQIVLYDGAAWNLVTFSTLSIALGSDTASLPYDVFGYLSSGALAIERFAWTNITTRATPLTTQDGILVKSGDATRRYLGSYATTGSAGQTEDSFAKRLVWNYYNRVVRPMRVLESTATWSYAVNTYRQANAAAGNQLAFLIGVAEVEVQAFVAGNVSTSDQVFVAIGADSTSVVATGCTLQGEGTPGGYVGGLSASLRLFPAAGTHFWAWLEKDASASAATWFGSGSGYQSGISGSLQG